MKIPQLSLLIGILFLTSPAVHADDVDQSPAPAKVVRAFPNLKLRLPTVVTNAGDGSGRLFVVNQTGKILIMPESQDGTETKTFLDISDRVRYYDKENEEGFLGLAFHPKFKQNGELFVYYTTQARPHTSIVSRFRVSKSDPAIADPATEEQLMEIPQPFWNHNGGGLMFGSDGYLYIALGDGGAANDPMGNGQNLGTLLGSILRIDVDHKSPGKAYAIPADNPFVKAKGAKPEIYAYGLRNPWGMSIDRKTGLFWCADVGQDIWEEIDLIEKGGNYGWNLREGFHKFGPKGSEPRSDLIEPIWEYKHDVGKSITGGNVYYGKRVPALEGHYIYADYVSGKVWGLKYDDKEKKVVANRQIESATMPYTAIGLDESGELYLADYFGQLWWLEAKGK